MSKDSNRIKIGTIGNDYGLDDLHHAGLYTLDFGEDNTIFALAGHDTIKIYNGDDRVEAGDGNDRIYDLGGGNDVILGQSGDDYIYAGTGTNFLQGGDGIDTVSYENSSTLAIVDLAWNRGMSSGTDSLESIENVVGTRFDDYIAGQGGAVNNSLEGGNGNDTLMGRRGDDALWGGTGDDILEGGEGADYLNGSWGYDFASYQTSESGVEVRLYFGSVSAFGDAEGDRMAEIEGVIGSQHSDSLLGDPGANTLIGNGGNDFLWGAGGDDRLDGGAGDDVLQDNVGDDVMTGGAGADRFEYWHIPDSLYLDVITDFEKGIDKIDLSHIDARPDVAGDQSFYFDPDPDSDDVFDGLDGSGGGVVYNGTMGIDGDTREVTFRYEGGNTNIYVSTGDYFVTAMIQLEGRIALDASDFLL